MVQTSRATAQKAIQDAITTKAKGEADAAKAKWEQEVIKAKNITKAESDKAVAQLAMETAALNKQRDILEGEGIAAKKRLVMAADGALNEKLAAYVKVQQAWATAFANYGGNVVPLYQTGGANGKNGAVDFMEIMGARSARDLMLDLSNKK
jgi:hypothetical protein